MTGARAPGAERAARRRAADEGRLAIWARRAARARRRRPLEAEGRTFDYRTEFQRDRDRLLHARAFRRLGDKGSSPQGGDAYRTRQTHCLEASQIGRTLARALGLNEDLVEAIALGHELGYPPLGAAGAAALDALLGGGVEGLPARALGGFEVAAQSLRVADRLERRYDHPGINLTDDVRAGIWKQADACRATGYPDEDRDGLDPGAPVSAEGQAVRLACRIAAATDALDDLAGSRPDLLERVERLGLGWLLLRKLGDRYRRDGARFLRRNQLHRGLTHLLVTSGIRQSRAALLRWAERERIGDERRAHDRRGALPPDAVRLPDRIEGLLAEAEAFVAAEEERTREAALRRRGARRVIEGLFRAYLNDPAALDDYVLLRFRDAEKLRFLRDVPASERDREVAERYRGSARLARMIGDHLAGMTDTYALREHRRLEGMEP
jgi:dGTPase